jgi:pyruvate kinase
LSVHKGALPVISVKWLTKICRIVEAEIDYHEMELHIQKNVEKPVGVSESIASSAVKCAREVNASFIIVVTEAGGTARLISKYRSSLPVVVITSDPLTVSQLTCSFGLLPVLYDEKNSDCGIIVAAMKFGVKLGLASPGDTVVISSGQVQGFLEGTTTTM